MLSIGEWPPANLSGNTYKPRGIADLSAVWRVDGMSALDDFESPVFIADKPVGNQLEVVRASHQDQILAWSQCDMWRQSKRLRRAVRLFGVQAEGQLPIGLDIQWNHRLGKKSVIMLPDVLHNQPHQPYMLQHFC